MTPTTPGLGDVMSLSKRLVKQLLRIGHGRLELLSVELQEERERLMLALLLALGTAVFGLLAGIVLTALIVLISWEYSPKITLVVLLALYAGAGFSTYLRLKKMQRDGRLFPATMEQLQKDRACLDQIVH